MEDVEGSGIDCSGGGVECHDEVIVDGLEEGCPILSAAILA